ncbi:serine protease snake-like [Nymphalis io]|uniref:serine protease snake-like n=1 Tax=Inachis io TaxID=171585 RepID=UPI002167F8F3|nr:serine protease snake-like [Nymphalis io]
MFFIHIFVTFFVACNGQTSTDALEKFLMDAIRSNETIDFDFDKYGSKPCEPYEPIKPNFSAPGRRISEQKCFEYIWEMENRENETEWTQICRLYLISEIKKGVVPEFLFVINTPVIFGGRPAVYEEFPHMGAIGWKAKNSSLKWVFKCGSTLISKKFLLTAAHCSKLSVRRSMDIVNSQPEIVRLGVENISDDQFNIYGNPVDVKIKRFIVHPKYKAPKKYYDIALIELQTEVKFMSNVQPACLWSDNDVSDLDTKGTLSGWGYTEHGTPSNQLQAAVVDFIETPVCETLLRKFRNRHWGGFQDHQMCAGNLTGGIDTCQGDSGSPVQVKIPLKTKGKIYWTVAITSFGIKCGQRNRPGVYTRVSSFIDWIEEIVWPSTNISL